MSRGKAQALDTASPAAGPHCPIALSLETLRSCVARRRQVSVPVSLWCPHELRAAEVGTRVTEEAPASCLLGLGAWCMPLLRVGLLTSGVTRGALCQVTGDGALSPVPVLLAPACPLTCSRGGGWLTVWHALRHGSQGRNSGGSVQRPGPRPAHKHAGERRNDLPGPAPRAEGSPRGPLGQAKAEARGAVPGPGFHGDREVTVRCPGQLCWAGWRAALGTSRTRLSSPGEGPAWAESWPSERLALGSP